MLLGSAEKKLIVGFGAGGAGAGAGGGGGGGTFFLQPAAEISRIANSVSSVALRLYMKMSNSPNRTSVLTYKLTVYFTSLLGIYPKRFLIISRLR